MSIVLSVFVLAACATAGAGRQRRVVRLARRWVLAEPLRIRMCSPSASSPAAHARHKRPKSVSRIQPERGAGSGRKRAWLSAFPG
jgi:hypothetical protein